MKKPILRRTFLKGAGVTIFLPFLESMWPQIANAQAASLKRYAFLTFPNGTMPGTWNYNDVLSPLASVQNQVTVLNGVKNYNGDVGNGAHSTVTAGILTQARAKGVGFSTERLDYAIGAPQMSIDQVIADALQTKGSLHSLVLKSPFEGGDFPALNLSTKYAARISWRGNVAVEAMTRVKDVFAAIYGVSGASVDMNKIGPKKSILDGISASAQSLNNKLGAEDKIRLGAYLESIREVEKRLPAATMPLPPQPLSCPITGAPRDVAFHSYDLWTKAMMDLIILAFQCGRTNVSTFQFFVDGGHHYTAPLHMDEIGLNDIIKAGGGEHEFSHRADNTYRLINKWYVGRLKYMIDKMSKISDVNGATLLDNSMVFLGSNFGNAREHGHTRPIGGILYLEDIPLILAGKGGGTIQSNGKVLNLAGASLASVHLTAARKMGANIQSFGRVGEINGFGQGDSATAVTQTIPNL